MTVREFQKLIRDTYFDRDNARGVDGTFRWFVEEVGELAKAIRNNASESPTPEARANLEEEFADVFAWLVTLAEMTGIDLEQVAADQYGKGCPKCGTIPCSCQ